MGRLEVRQAIQAQIQNGQIPMVGTVYAARAYVSEEDYEVNAFGFYMPNVHGSSAVIVVDLPGEDDRRRITVQPKTAVFDFNVHPVILEIFFASRSGGVGDQLVQAQLDYDAIVDALTILIRKDPNMGAPATIWQAGEAKMFVKHRQGEPFTTDDWTTTFIYGNVRFEAWEADIGPAGTV